MFVHCATIRVIDVYVVVFSLVMLFPLLVKLGGYAFEFCSYVGQLGVG